MQNGTVKWFNAQKGFGFIRPKWADPMFSFTLAPLNAPALTTSPKVKSSLSKWSPMAAVGNPRRIN